MDALDHARGLLVMARKDFDALRGMIDKPSIPNPSLRSTAGTR